MWTSLITISKTQVYTSHRWIINFWWLTLFEIIILESKTIIHIADTATRFSTETYLDSHKTIYGQSVEDICLVFIITWAKIYSGYPTRMRKDQGSVFTFDGWKQLTELAGYKLEVSGVKAHRSVGIEELLH